MLDFLNEQKSCWQKLKEENRPIFIYGMGKSGRYHHKSDTLENMSLGGYTGLFQLITNYINLYNAK